MDASTLAIAISALEKEISEIESSINGLEGWLWFWSSLVAIGVILEVVFLIGEYREYREAWLRGILAPPPRPSLRVLLFEAASIMLVVVGIVGELWIGVISANRNTDLRSKNGKLVGLINQRSSDANERAADAIEEAKELEKQTTELRARSVRILPRSALLYGKPEIDFVASLKRFKGQTVNISTCWPRMGITLEPEIDALDARIVEVFKDAKWTVKTNGNLACLNVCPVEVNDFKRERVRSCKETGIRIGTRSSSSRRAVDVARMLVTELGKLPLSAKPLVIDDSFFAEQANRSSVLREDGPDDIFVGIFPHPVMLPAETNGPPSTVQ